MFRRLWLALLLVPGMALAQPYTTRTAHVFEYRPLSTSTSQGNHKTYFVGDTLFYELSGLQYRFLFATAGHNEVLGYDSTTRTWGPVAVGTDTGGGGVVRLDQLGNPLGTKNFTLDANASLSFGQTGLTPATASAFTWEDNTSGATSRAFLRINTAAGNLSKPFQVTAGGTANGVYMDNSGVLRPMGSGGISASQFNGNTIIPYTSLDANLARINASQVYSAKVEIWQGSAASSFATVNTLNAPANATGLYAEAYYGTAGRFKGYFAGSKGVNITSPGLGLAVNSDNDTIATFRYNGALKAHVDAAGLKASAYLHSTLDSTKVVYGDAWRPVYHGKAIFASNDTATVTGLTGLDSSNAIVQVSFIHKPDAPATLGAFFSNAGTLSITSSTSSMRGIRVYYSVYRNNTTYQPAGDQ